MFKGWKKRRLQALAEQIAKLEGEVAVIGRLVHSGNAVSHFIIQSLWEKTGELEKLKQRKENLEVE